MSDLATAELYRRYVMPTYGRFELAIARGAGCRVWDEAGREYLDFGAGIAVCSLGHAHPRLTRVLAEQAAKLVHTSNLYHTRPQGLLAERLVRLVGHPGKIFCCNSGAEANEALYKLARKFGNEAVPPAATHAVGELAEPAPPRVGIITFRDSFHGRTLGGIAATGQEKVKRGFEPIIPEFTHVPFGDAPALRAAITPATGAILLEPIQGEIGVRPARADFLRTVRKICDDLDLLLMFDEVQSGLGRTGDWCSWRSLGAAEVIPDAISWAKGIAGGFPMGAVWVRDRPIALQAGGEISLADLLGPGSHGTTFGGTPLAATLANEVLTIIEEENLLAHAREIGAHAQAQLAALRSPLIAEIRGVGLMLGLQLVPDFPAEKTAALELTRDLQIAGLLVVPSGTHAIRWLPPLNVTRAEVDEAVDILRRVLQNAA